MPYIKQSDRSELIRGLRDSKTPGELNYLISQTVRYYLETKGESYQTYNDIIGVLECLKLEIYRRLIAQYEDKKIKENGDVFEDQDYNGN